jgi:hypothetical protein
VGTDRGDEVVYRLTRFDQQHHPARPFETGDQLLDTPRADHFPAVGRAGEEIVHLRYRAIEHRHPEAVVVHVEHEVLAHHRQTDETDVCLFHFLSSRYEG